MESPVINSYIYGKLIFDKGTKIIEWGKNSLFKKQCRDSWRATCKRMKLGPYLIPYTKN